MKLYLIPITTRRVFLYAQRLNKITRPTPSLADKASAKAAAIWLNWETGEKQWQRKITEAGNKLFNRIPYEEWGLKSVPPLSARRQQEEVARKKIEVVYPPSVIGANAVPDILGRLGTERNSLHRSRFIWCLIGMPITAPIGLIPAVPNIPFFYLLYRAFSHRKALLGAKHLEFLVDNSLLKPTPSAALDAIYHSRRSVVAAVDHNRTSDKATAVWSETDRPGSSDPTERESTSEESLLVREEDAKEIAAAINVPSLALEAERAARQVAEQLKVQAQAHAQQARIEKAEDKTEEAKRNS